MRLGVLIHGGLLVVALLFGYQTATRTETVEPTGGTHVVWDMPAKVTALHMESDNKSLQIAYKEDKQGPYLWGTVKRTSNVGPKKPRKPVVAAGVDAGVEAQAPEAEPEVKVTTRVFPVGSRSEEIFAGFQTLMALRAVGVVAADKLQEYDLHEKTMNVTVFFGKDVQKTLLIAGKSIYGGNNRYMLDLENNKVYVGSGKLISPLNSAETSLGLRKVHAYEKDSIAAITVKTTAKDKTILRTVSEDEKGTHTVWSDAETPNDADQTLANFIDRVDKLRPTQYEPELAADKLIHLATFRYLDKAQQALGYLELYRQPVSMQEPASEPSQSPPATQYYIRTERTHGFGKVGRLSAERIDQDLIELFGVAPEPESETPKGPTPKAPTPPVPNSHAGHAH